MSVQGSDAITVTEQVIYELRERILDGKYPPGAHLHEVVTANDLNVSRTPVRDAMRVLANEELLAYYPNRGYIVRGVDVKDVLDAFDVRGTLEGMGCRIVAEQGMDEETERQISLLLEKGEKIFQSSTWGDSEQKEWRSLNTEFHFRLLGAAHNRHLDPVMRQMRIFPRLFDSRFASDSEFFQKVYTREQRLRSHHDHIHIVDAVRRREGSRAEALMREHIYANREVLRLGIAVAGQSTGARKAPKKS
jgi:GntR family transcriptional regulator of vanillate catabolism